MDIYVDVEVHKLKPYGECKFLFNTFSSGHDVYIHKPGEHSRYDSVVFVGPMGSVHWLNQSAGLSTWRPGIIGDDIDVEYIRKAIEYAVLRDIIDEKFLYILNRIE